MACIVQHGLLYAASDAGTFQDGLDSKTALEITEMVQYTLRSN